MSTSLVPERYQCAVCGRMQQPKEIWFYKNKLNICSMQCVKEYIKKFPKAKETQSEHYNRSFNASGSGAEAF